ncbi:hypothetical protein N7492_008561 [Penicillium capsulatum]|uniref:Threonyl/alanyl tRNA synthetase SAD domain-containing protein n=1 Tax=Penicillium capsulatum TaxID=69766 RepID=A0A9W9LH17_9EURO|nr:hypothetical protein N7492_008561 [Penicillium capsulatum]KAJ6105967.1 hypothetical protein N7512_009484 [Penicillium capsulatum]
MATPTEAVYLYDGSLRSLATEVVSYQPISSLSETEKSLAKNVTPDASAMVTRQTILYPQGGGQASDIGSITPTDQSAAFTVSLVRKMSDGRILHFGKPVTAGSVFTEGQSVVQSVDNVKRDYHSRLHTAGHIIGVAMDFIMPGMKEVKANHMPGEACIEYNGLLYNEHKPLIQTKVDELVQEDLPVTISWPEAGIYIGERAKPGDGPLRIVSIGGLDQCPCGGTHVASTHLVRSITIRKISRQKGISRVSYDVPKDV